MRNTHLLLALFFLNSCNGPYPPFQIDELYVQKIPESSLLIYDFYASGGFDAVKEGYIIQDSTEEFNISKVTKLPISLFLDVPNNKIINTAYIITPQENSPPSLEPIDRNSTIIGQTKINFTTFNRSSGSTIPYCGLKEYEFDSFTETSDSLFFYGVKNTRDSLQVFPDGLGFQKGNVKLIGNIEGIVGRVVIENIIKTIGKKRIYKPQSTVLDHIEENYPIVCTKTYYLNPRRKVQKNEFSDYGIFKITYSRW